MHKQNKNTDLTATGCEIQKYKIAFAKMGGKAGRGKAKRRSPEHYKRMVEARWGKKSE